MSDDGERLATFDEKKLYPGMRSERRSRAVDSVQQRRTAGPSSHRPSVVLEYGFVPKGEEVRNWVLHREPLNTLGVDPLSTEPAGPHRNVLSKDPKGAIPDIRWPESIPRSAASLPSWFLNGTGLTLGRESSQEAGRPPWREQEQQEHPLSFPEAEPFQISSAATVFDSPSG
jgi:hypothetical protein